MKINRFFILSVICILVLVIAPGMWWWQKKRSFAAQARPALYDLNPENENVDVRVFFGYKDARPARFVADRYEKSLFLQRLTGPCVGRRLDCGFLKYPDEETSRPSTVRFYKNLLTQNGAHVRVNIKVFASSVGADDDENRENPFQKWRSDFMKEQFTQALQQADIVFYNGHSRAGGGPDFSVPELTRLNHVRYPEYQKQKWGFNLIKNTLKAHPESPLRMISLYSCESDQLFRKRIEAAKPRLKVVGSRQLLYFSDAFNDSLNQLSDILESLQNMILI